MTEFRTEVSREAITSRIEERVGVSMYRTGVSANATTTRVDKRTGASTCRPNGMAGATRCREGVITGKAAPSTDASVELVAEASKTLSQLPVSHAAPSQGSSNNHISKKGLG
jgi:predicted TIM-barrel enzyme